MAELDIRVAKDSPLLCPVHSMDFLSYIPDTPYLVALLSIPIGFLVYRRSLSMKDSDNMVNQTKRNLIVVGGESASAIVT